LVATAALSSSAILTASLLDADDHPLAVDVGDLERDHLGGVQTTLSAALYFSPGAASSRRITCGWHQAGCWCWFRNDAHALEPALRDLGGDWVADQFE
jgi:hypothetical protein